MGQQPQSRPRNEVVYSIVGYSVIPASISRKASSFVPPIISTALCIAVVLSLAWCIKSKTDGLFVYPLDDSYIHLAIARTLAEHHVWGISPAAFASASSSPGWTLLLAAADLIFGTHLITPIVLNLLLAGFLLVLADAFLCSVASGISVTWRIVAGAVIVVATPLPSLVLLGMEHVAQTALVFLFIWYGARIACLEAAQPVPRQNVLIFLLAAGGAATVRYESVFPVVLVGAILVWRKRWGIAALLALAAAAGPFAFGAYFYHHSGLWLPFSVISKSILSHPSLVDGINSLSGRSSVPIVLFCLLVWAYRRFSRGFWDETQIVLLLTAGVGLLHSLFAPVGWLMRYESYFVCIAIIALLAVLAQRGFDLHPRTWKSSGSNLAQRIVGVTAALVFLLMLVKFIHRVELGLVLPVEAAVDRYSEHIQMARFVTSNYDHDTIVVNDIGAVSFYSQAKLLDVLGLGSEESLRALKATKRLLPSQVEPWAKDQHAAIAIIMIDQENNTMGIPEDWVLAQVWRIPRNLIFRDHSIGFFATQRTEVSRLCEALERFKLPKGDSVSYNACPLLTGSNPAARAAIPADIVKREAQTPY